MAIQGYDKTATYSSIATGNVIEAAYFTNEFAEIFTAFAKTSSTSSSGHRHDGGDAMGGYNALLSDSDNDTKISVETISISGGAPSYTDSDTITIVAGSATIATIDSGDINVAANKGITFGDDGEKIEGDGTDLTITGNNINLTATADVNIPSGVGVTFATAEKIESDGTDLSITVGSGGDINIPADIGLTFGDDGEKIEGDGTDLTISGNNINLTATADVNIPSGVGITFATAEKIESDGTDLSITVGSGGDINVPASIGITFGDDGEKIEGDGTDLTISASADLNLTATTDINIPANVGLTFGDDAEKIEGDGTDLTISGNNINLTATSDVNIPSGVGLTFATAEKIESDGTDLTITVGSSGDINIPANIGVTFGDDGEKIEGDGTDLTISGNNINLTATADVNIPSGVGITFATAEKIESDGTDLSITVGSGGDINIPTDIGLTFGDDGEKIEGDGTDLTISSSALATIDAGTDITLDAGGGDIFFKDDGTTFGSATNSSGNLIIKSGTTTALTFSGANVTGSGTLEATTITASTAFVPDASGGADLGSTSLEFGDLYIADDKKIYLGSDQDFSIEYDEDGNDTTAIVASTGVSLAPHGTSSGNTTPLQFQELAANGAHYIGFKAPDSISANVTWTLPNADGSANQVIKTDGSGTLSWSTASSGAVTAINNATANELVTIGSTTTELDAEGNLTFDGSTLAVTGDATISDDLGLISDAAVLTFGANSEITLTHVHDTGLNLKHTATADDKPIVLTLQTGETDMAADDVMGKIAFQAPDEGTGTDAVLVAAAIQARSEGDFSSSSNATSLDFMTGSSEAAATKWSITSTGSFLNAGTNTIDMNAGELILDADQDTSITADTDDQIDIRIAGADDFQFTANTFTAQSGSTIAAQALTATTIGTGDGSAGSPSYTFTSDTDTGMFWVSAGILGWTSQGTEEMRLSDQRLFLSDTANTGAAGAALTINQAHNDDAILSLKSSDVAHGVTGSAETDTYYQISKYDGAPGGAQTLALSEGTIAQRILTVATGETTDDTSNSTANIWLFPLIKDGTGNTTHGSTGNIVAMGNGSTTRWLLKGNGDVHQTTDAHTALDAFSDTAVCRVFDMEFADPSSIIKSKWDDFINSEDRKEQLIAAGLISRMSEEDEANGARPLFNASQLQRLHNGAIWQQWSIIQTMREICDEMLPGFSKKLNDKLAEQNLPALPVSI